MSVDSHQSSTLVRAGTFAIDRSVAERLTGGVWHGTSQGVEIYGASIDSRHVEPGCLFVCLPGATYDGHDFAATAVGDGAAMVLASRPLSLPVPTLVVPNVTRALGELASEYRRRRTTTTWIGVTGSNGKTTVKELIAAACAGSGRVHATRGNLNNDLGVPLSILATPGDALIAVIEMGANHSGEISTLAAMARPQVGVITSIGPAHLEGFGSLLGVARGKAELFTALPDGAHALLGTIALAQMCAQLGVDLHEIFDVVRRAALGRRLELIGSPEHPIHGVVGDEHIELQTPAGSATIQLLGAHNLANAAIAYAAALAAGVTPSQALRGLAAMAAVPGRLVARRFGPHLIIDDSYNANPGSMMVGLEVLATYKTRTVAVLGAMGELGSSTKTGHQQVGAHAARLHLPLVTVGDGARTIFQAYTDAGGTDAAHADDRHQALTLVRHRLQLGATSVLVKASRSAGLEWIVAQLLGARGDAS
jgi:UDP-N-acetylmuramoyl-tripeptide--D-alanyl-D-alanine ligase